MFLLLHVFTCLHKFGQVHLGWDQFDKEHAATLPQIDNLLTVAERNGAEFVTEVLTSAGYDEVVFVSARD